MRKNIKKIDENSLKKDLKEIWKSSEYDPDGSYIGVSENERYPVQDADDL